MIPVGVNLLWLRPGVVGGSEEYLCRQLSGLRELDHDYDVTILGLAGLAEAHPELAVHYPIEVAPARGSNRAWRVVMENSWLAARARRHRVRLMHHGGGTAPAIGRGPRSVVTIHDLQYVRFPDSFSLLKRSWLRRAVPTAVRRADAVTVPSEYVRQTVIESLAAAPERVVVVPHGLLPVEPPGPEAVSAARARYGLPGPFIVYPAITYPHKNHLVLVRALAVLQKSHPDVQLVLLGAAGSAEDDLRAEIAGLALGTAVVRPGRVPAADRDALYLAAGGLVFPSRYEGFGAPVIEAMAAGCPVIAARTAALPEVVGGAGLLVDPDEPEEWADAIALVLDDPGQADLLRQAGLSRAVGFTARRSAAALLTAYGLALA